MAFISFNLVAMLHAVTFSIGAAIFERLADRSDQDIEFADLLMYDVKKSGKLNILFRPFQ